jgi:hypothetical protein
MKSKNTYVIQAWSPEDECWLDCEEATYTANPRGLDRVRAKFESWVGGVEGLDLRVIQREEVVILEREDIL